MVSAGQTGHIIIRSMPWAWLSLNDPSGGDLSGRLGSGVWACRVSFWAMVKAEKSAKTTSNNKMALGIDLAAIWV